MNWLDDDRQNLNAFAWIAAILMLMICVAGALFGAALLIWAGVEQLVSVFHNGSI